MGMVVGDHGLEKCCQKNNKTQIGRERDGGRGGKLYGWSAGRGRM